METKSKNWYKKFVWLGIAACGLCCALPIIGTMAGISVLTTFGAYYEKTGIVALAIVGVLFALHFYQKNKTKKQCDTFCNTGCGCKTEATTK